MSKKVVVITGSPRKNGNSFAMTDSFIQAAEAKGHTVTRFDAAFLKIGGCHACETCFKTGKACSFDDDFNTIAPAILEADVAGLYHAGVLVFHPRPDQRCHRPALFPGGGRQGHRREGVCPDRLLRGGGPDRIGRRPHPHGAHRCSEQVDDGGRGTGARRSECGRHRQRPTAANRLPLWPTRSEGQRSAPRWVVQAFLRFPLAASHFGLRRVFIPSFPAPQVSGTLTFLFHRGKMGMEELLFVWYD